MDGLFCYMMPEPSFHVWAVGGACRGVLENQETVTGCRTGSRFQTLPCSSLKTQLFHFLYYFR